MVGKGEGVSTDLRVGGVGDASVPATAVPVVFHVPLLLHIPLHLRTRIPLRRAIHIPKHRVIRPTATSSLLQDEQVMSVQVHRMRLIARVLEHETYGFVVAVIMHVPDLLEVEIAELGFQEDGIVVVGAEGAVRHVPEEVAGGVGLELDGDDFCYAGLAGIDGVGGDGLR